MLQLLLAHEPEMVVPRAPVPDNERLVQAPVLAKLNAVKVPLDMVKLSATNPGGGLGGGLCVYTSPLPPLLIGIT